MNWDEMAVVGRVARPHGIRGQVVLNLETDFPHEREAGVFAKDIPEFWARNDLSEQVKRKVFSENAKRFYALS